MRTPSLGSWFPVHTSLRQKPLLGLRAFLRVHLSQVTEPIKSGSRLSASQDLLSPSFRVYMFTQVTFGCTALETRMKQDGPQVWSQKSLLQAWGCDLLFPS